MKAVRSKRLGPFEIQALRIARGEGRIVSRVLDLTCKTHGASTFQPISIIQGSEDVMKLFPRAVHRDLKIYVCNECVSLVKAISSRIVLPWEAFTEGSLAYRCPFCGLVKGKPRVKQSSDIPGIFPSKIETSCSVCNFPLGMVILART